MREKVRCPSCRKEVPWQGNPWRPFCSERCRMVDLSAWLSERYRIPGEAAGQETAVDGEKEAGGGGNDRTEPGRREPRQRQC